VGNDATIAQFRIFWEQMPSQVRAQVIGQDVGAGKLLSLNEIKRVGQEHRRQPGEQRLSRHR